MDEGAYIARSEKRLAVDSFEQALNWLMEEAKKGENETAKAEDMDKKEDKKEDKKKDEDKKDKDAKGGSEHEAEERRRFFFHW